MSEHAPHIRSTIDYLRDRGATDVRYEIGSKHPKIGFDWKGERLYLVMPGTPRDSDHAINQARQKLAREFGITEADRPEFEPQGPLVAATDPVAIDTTRMPIVMIQDGETWADSRDVAAYFGKNHKDVLRTIREMWCSDEFRRRNFAPFKIKDLAGESTSHVLLTKDGFIFLVMGFTGQKAAEHKESYIAEFNSMDRELSHNGYRALAERMARLEQEMRTRVIASDPRIGALENLPPLEIAKRMKVLPSGRRQLCKTMSDQMARISAAWAVPVVLCHVTGRRLFSSAVIDHWMQSGGRGMIERHKATIAGQGILPFPKRKDAA